MLNGEVSSESAYFINMQLMYLDSVDKTKDINLYINSPGGSVYDGLAMYDTINSLTCKVNIVVTGMAASMGAFLLSSGTGIRAITPEARVMVHSVSSRTSGTVWNQLVDMDETVYLNNRLHKIMSKNSGGYFTEETMKEFTKQDRWLSAQEAIDMGLADRIVGE